MSNLIDKWNRNNFSIYNSEEKTVLGLIEDISNFNSEIIKEIDNKTDLFGDHKGSWQGLNKPTLSEEGAFAQVERNQSDIEYLISTNASNPYYVFEQYNIVGDGVTDDTENFQRMMNNESKIIIPPNKIIKITDELHLSGENSFSIDGNGSTLLCENEGLYRALLFDHCKNVTIRDLKIDMNLKGRTSIDFNFCENYLVENCIFTGYTLEYGWYPTDGGIRIESSKDGKIFNNYFVDSGNGMGAVTETLNRCIGVGGNSENTKIIGNTFKRVSQAIVTDSINIDISNNYFEDVEDNSIYLVGDTENVTINSNTFYHSLDECIVLSGVGHFTVTNNNFDEVENKCIAINSSMVNVTISGNNIRSTEYAPANVIAWRTDKMYSIIDNFNVIGNLISIPVSNTNELFTIGNVRNGIFSNNFITTISNSRIIAFRGTDVLRWTMCDSVFDNTSGTYTTIFDNNLTSYGNKELIIDNLKFINGRGAISFNNKVKIYNMRYQNTGSTIYLNGNRLTSESFAGSVPSDPIKGTKGDIVYNTSPSPGGYIGWVCTEGDGTALGTWKGFGLIQS